jgi:hypothetical protein
VRGVGAVGVRVAPEMGHTRNVRLAHDGLGYESMGGFSWRNHR